jgi:hypothetical protein
MRYSFYGYVWLAAVLAAALVGGAGKLFGWW